MTNEEIVERIQNGSGDLEALQRELCEKNRGYIAKIANVYTSWAESEDLIQEGYIGLLEAARRCRLPDCGDMFITYAGNWIRAKMQRYIRESGHNIRIPGYKIDLLIKYRRFTERWERERGEPPPESEICGNLGINPETLGEIRRAAKTAETVSIYTETGDALPILDTIADPADRIAEALERIQNQQTAERIRRELGTLPDKQQKVIRARYWNGSTLKEAGQIIGSGAEAARQHEKKALRELRKDKHGLREYYELEATRAAGMKKTGVQTFRRTWTSATERAAIKELEAARKRRETEAERKLKSRESREKPKNKQNNQKVVFTGNRRGTGENDREKENGSTEIS